MKRIAEKYGVPSQYQHLIIGSAKQVIADFTSKHGIDVVVMSAIHHPGIERIIGSTTEQALYKVKTSILAVQA